ncbi:MAG: helix-turn-helix domain-containing protein [Actinomycetota bacterium]
MYKWQQVKAMQANGIGAKTIAKKLNLSKNTVKKYMRSNEPPRFNTPLKKRASRVLWTVKSNS